jgi:hypothetical protein
MKTIIYFNKPLKKINLIVKIYLTPSWNQKLTLKNLFIFKKIFQTYFYKLKFENKCTHISELSFLTKKINVS